jgi:hypothetical protein
MKVKLLSTKLLNRWVQRAIKKIEENETRIDKATEKDIIDDLVKENNRAMRLVFNVTSELCERAKQGE